MKKFFKDIKFIDVLPYVVFLIAMIFVIALKFDYHVDETLTYSLSNNSDPVYYMDPQEGFRYEPSIQPYLDYLTVKKGESFSYSIPYFKQYYESHPPIYYALVHTVCSLFPGSFSRWYAGAVNIIFALGTLFVLRRIVELLTENKLIKNCLTWGFVSCYAVLSEVSFFRMYVVTLFLTTLTTYIFMWQLQSDRGKWFYILASFVVLVGALTYYGTLIFSLAICVIYGIYLLINKKWKDVYKFVGGMAIAGGIAIAVFPAIIRQVFGDGRGGEAIGNMFNLSDYIDRLKSFVGFYNDFVFGRILLLLLIVLVALIIYANRQGKLSLDKTKMMYYIILIAPSLIFFLVASKSAPYHEERYTSLTYANAYIGIMCPLLSLLNKLFEKKLANIISICLIAIISTIGLTTNKWQYLYRWEKPSFDLLDPYREYDCLCIHGGENWRLNTYILELTKYNSVTYVRKSEMENYNLEDYITTGNGIVVLAGISDKNVIDEVMNYLPNYSGYEYVSENSFYVYK